MFEITFSLDDNWLPYKTEYGDPVSWKGVLKDGVLKTIGWKFKEILQEDVAIYIYRDDNYLLKVTAKKGYKKGLNIIEEGKPFISDDLVACVLEGTYQRPMITLVFEERNGPV